MSTKIDLLRLGANDYITKPFQLGEVLARIESILRRIHKQVMPIKQLHHKDVMLDDDAKRVTLNGEEVNLTAKQYLLLKLFMDNQDKVFTKANYMNRFGMKNILEMNILLRRIFSRRKSSGLGLSFVKLLVDKLGGNASAKIEDGMIL